MNENMKSSKSSLRYLFTAVNWVICLLWIAQLANAAPLPQSGEVVSVSASPSTNTTNNTLVDPFSTPDYLAPSEFTWEQCIYGILFIFFGGVEVFHGYKYIRITMLVAGFFVWSSTAVMVMLITNINSGVYQSTTVYFIVWLLIGIIGSIISFYLWHVGIILTGAYGVFVIVAVIFTAANVTNYVFRYVFLAICVVIGGYLTKRYERYAVIIATSLGGAYCVMFGIDMFVQSEFRSTFHVMLSQSTDRFHPVAGTWVMIAFVPVIAAIGTAWEWKHHEAPVGSWWFGHGARPLPPLPGERPHRKCCGITMALSAKAAKAAKAAKETEEKTTGSDTTLVSPSTKTTTMAGEAKAGSSSLPLSWSHWCFPCCTRRNNKTTTAEDNGPSSTAEAMEAEPMTVVVASDAPATEGSSPREEKPYNVLVNEKSKPTAGPSVTFIKEYDIPIERAYFSSGRETIGHTGVQKVVIQREVREFGVDVDEKL